VVWGETMADAVRREILEETGLRVELGEMAGLVERILPDEGFHYIIIDYFVTVTGGDLNPGGDALDARWVPIKSIEELPLSPRLLESLKDFGVID
jgi:8-oxo-dGTP diphosphatase